MSLLNLRRTKVEKTLDQRLSTGRDGLPSGHAAVKAVEQLLREARKR